jgi:hypothetical protein
MVIALDFNHLHHHLMRLTIWLRLNSAFSCVILLTEIILELIYVVVYFAPIPTKLFHKVWIGFSVPTKSSNIRHFQPNLQWETIILDFHISLFIRIKTVINSQKRISAGGCVRGLNLDFINSSVTDRYKLSTTVFFYTFGELSSVSL